LLDSLIAWLDVIGASTNHVLGLAALAGSAGIEYIFPPFPGDVITVFGGVLVAGYGWSLPLVFAVVTVGSMLGGLIAFGLARRWHLRRAPNLAEQDSKLARLVQRFHKRGSLYLLLNRFLPGIRPLFFVAAGLSGMSTRRVLLLSGVSAAVWNSLLLLAGATVGHNLDRIQGWLKTYNLVVWAILGVLAIFYLARRARRRRELQSRRMEE
jgi:membrane-associated protein